MTLSSLIPDSLKATAPLVEVFQSSVGGIPAYKEYTTTYD